MFKRIGIVALVAAILVVGGVVGRKVYKKRAIQRPPTEEELTKTETFTLKNVRPARFQTVAPAQEDRRAWTQFLGQGSRAHSACQPPLEWSETKNIIWKIAVPGIGHASPVVKDGQLWLACTDNERRSAQILCIDSATGNIVRQLEVFHSAKPMEVGLQASPAPSTPILDGAKLFVHFPMIGTACLSTASGDILWKNEEIHVDGYGGASPLLCGSRLIISVDGNTEQYLAALDSETGRLLWKTPRSQRTNPTEIRRAFATPVAVDVDGQTQIISAFVDRVCGYDPESGQEIWHVDYRGHCNVPRPAVGEGLLFVCTGWDAPQLWAIHAGGTGDITETHVLWKAKRHVPLIASPLVVGHEIYFVSDKGIASCVQATTGDILWSERLQGAFSASPLFIGGKIYLFNETGQTFVLNPGKTFDLLHTNQLADGCFATPAVADDALFVRTPTHLYRIGRTN